jgi:putative OPT family oligopeptide transporter
MQPNDAEPATSLKELTLRGLILGALITLVFTAANVYLGLKVGLTFASSIPAAVISMVVLRLIGGATVLENNIVQTQASAAGTLSAIIFVIPGLIMVGHWHGVPWFEAAGLCAAGGVLGVLFTIPLRRALVVESALPFPEGVAAAEVLRLGESGAAGGARELAIGGAVAAVFNLLSSGFAIFADSATLSFSLGGAVFRLGTGFSLALVGAGYLMGIAAGVAILIGVIAGWGVALPILTAITPVPAGADAQAFAMTLWRQQVRFIGAGTIAIAAVWTLGTLVPSIARGLATSFGAARRTIGAAPIDRTDRDIAGPTLLALAAAALLGLFVIFMVFLGPDRWALALYSAVFAAIFGFLTAAACGYMAGIVGSSASPISGIGIIAVSLASLTLLALPAESSPGPVAVALFITSAIVAIATISNDNLQDLKTGQLVEATPAKQQIALIIGVFAGAVVIPPLIDLLYRAYGFAGALPRPDMDPSKALAAPQATLMSAIANGVLGHKLDWTMISIGFAFGAALIVVDLILKRTTTNLRLPALAAGIGLYLPATVSVTLVIGAIISWLAQRALSQRTPEQKAAAEQRGVLLASGLIVGESLIGVIIAAIIGATGRQDALSVVGSGFETTATWLGAMVFFVVCVGFGRLVVARAS